MRGAIFVPRRSSKKKVAVFDIDGTIFRSSLLIELTEALIQEGVFPKKVRNAYSREYKRWLERKGSYEAYIDAVVVVFWQTIKGVKRSVFLKVAREVVALHHDRVYRYTRDLVKDLRRKNYYIVAISNSPWEIVEAFCKKLGFSKVYGRVYEADAKGKFTGTIQHLELISDKAKILRRVVEKEGLTLRGSVGVGDTESDVAFLRLVDRPICFNPNRKLLAYATRNGWKVVVERKDVIHSVR